MTVSQALVVAYDWWFVVCCVQFEIHPMLAQLELRQHCQQLQIAVQVHTHCALLLRLQHVCAGVCVTRQS